MTLHTARLIALGVLWGSGVMFVQALELPVGDGGTVAWSALAWGWPGWSAVGVAMALAVDRWSPWLERPGVAVPTVFVAALVLSALWTGMYTLGSAGLPHAEWSNARIADPWGAFAYQAWLIAFYGGWYVIAWTLRSRMARCNDLLSRLELARLVRRQRSGEDEIERLRGRVDPMLMLEAIAESHRRAATDDASVENLLARLTAYLRDPVRQEADLRTTLGRNA